MFMNDNEFINNDNHSHKTISIYLRNDDSINKILNFMGSISKNVYNTTFYIYTIYMRYKHCIFKNVIDRIKDKEISTEKFYKYVQAEIKYFYDLHSKKDSVMKSNNDFLYKKIKEKLNKIELVDSNYFKLKNEVFIENKKLIKHHNQYEYKFIIDTIFKSIYIKNYKLTTYELSNKIPCTIKNINFINLVKGKITIFPDSKSIKSNIKQFGTLQGDQNIITRFIYKHLGENINKLPSNIILNIIAKAFDNIKGYYALKNKGLKSNIPRYLKKDQLFILPFFKHSFRIDQDNKIVRLSVGKYISQNYEKITEIPELVILNKNESTEYKKYCLSKNLTNIVGKINKLNNFIVDNKYIDRSSEKIIDASYLYFKLPDIMIDKNITLIEINPINNGHCFKLNYVYRITKTIIEHPIKKIEPVSIEKKQNLSKKKEENVKKPVKSKKTDQIERLSLTRDKNNKIIIDASKCVSIDLGMVNLATIHDPSGDQLIIKGTSLIAVNNYHNMKMDKLQSEIDKSKDGNIKKKKQAEIYDLEINRKNWINEFFNKVVKYLYIIYNKTKELIIVGYNLNWKNGVNMNTKTNRKFYQIPYAKFLYKLKDKFGDKILINEESYTSKCDALSLEKIDKHDQYLGKRIRRGLFSSPKGLINADLNGAINIMRKVVDLKEIKGKNLFNPKVAKIYTPTKVKLSGEAMPVGKGTMESRQKM
jgi:IS605 OrfB family transposase